MDALAIGRKTIKWMNAIVNFILLILVVLLMAYAVYALWDSQQVHNVADKSHYEAYKPTAQNEGKSFLQLQAINADVFTWLTIYGTNIDYPMAQGPDNMKYVSTNAEGEYSLSGAIFLDRYNSRDFSDFNSIVYGHHMEKKAMFGEIGDFQDREMFDTHRYGNLYYDGRDHGIEFFAFLQVDAYDKSVFTPNVSEADRAAYLGNLSAKSVHQRDIGVTADDHIILLSTCSSGTTNGRDILAGRVTDKVFMDTTLTGANGGGLPVADGRYGFVKAIPLWAALLTLLTLLVTARLALVLRETRIRQKRRKLEQKRSGKICLG